jgi:hypothetical protein
MLAADFHNVNRNSEGAWLRTFGRVLEQHGVQSIPKIRLLSGEMEAIGG